MYANQFASRIPAARAAGRNTKNQVRRLRRPQAHPTYRRPFDSCYFMSMFDIFSVRARQVVFAARFKAGARGAETIDTDDFLVALILEDQGAVAKTIFSEIHKGQGAFVNQVPSHMPFIPLKTAEDLQAKIESLLHQSQPVVLTAEIPLSPSLERVFDSAKAIQARLQHREIEPLHLLAAILREESSQGVKLLQDAGITQEKVLMRLSEVAEN